MNIPTARLWLFLTFSLSLFFAISAIPGNLTAQQASPLLADTSSQANTDILSGEPLRFAMDSRLQLDFAAMSITPSLGCADDDCDAPWAGLLGTAAGVVVGLGAALLFRSTCGECDDFIVIPFTLVGGFIGSKVGEFIECGRRDKDLPRRLPTM